MDEESGGVWIRIVDAAGRRSSKLGSEGELALALMDAAWVGSPAVGIVAGGPWAALPIRSAALLAEAMRSYVHRGSDARIDISKRASELARAMWPMVEPLWEAGEVAAAAGDAPAARIKSPRM